MVENEVGCIFWSCTKCGGVTCRALTVTPNVEFCAKCKFRKTRKEFDDAAEAAKTKLMYKGLEPWSYADDEGHLHMSVIRRR